MTKVLKPVAALVLVVALIFVARYERSPLLGKWKAAQGLGQPCGEISGFEFNYFTYALLLTNGARITGSVNYRQDSDGDNFSVIPEGGYTLNGKHYDQFIFT